MKKNKKCKHVKRGWCLTDNNWADKGTWSSNACWEVHQVVLKCIRCGEFFDE